MSSRRSTVKARTNQIESALATAEYKKQHIHVEEPKRSGKSKQKQKTRAPSDDESDDEMDFVELVRALTIGEIGPAGSHNELDALREAFKILDCDEDGFITLSDLREAMTSFEDEAEDQTTDEELLEMITEADEEGSGRINFESFVRMLEPAKMKKKTKRSSTSSSSQKSM